VNPQHLRAFVWLRWRLLINQLHRGGIANVVIVSILVIALLLFAVIMTVAAFLAGLYAFNEASPYVLLIVWDGLVLAFLFSWSIGLLTELQRSEGLSLEKFLHLPVSLSGVFFLNYLSSLFSLTLCVFGPMMAGLSIGLVCARGPVMLLLLPLLAAFILMVTGITYQFQGWLASLMVNKRRRRTIIVIVTLVFITVFQLPTLINLLVPWKGPKEEAAATKKQHDDLQAALAKGDIDAAEFQKRSQDAVQKAVTEFHQKNEAMWQQVKSAIEIANLAMPIGWLPYGALSLADGSIWPAPLCALAMGAIGTASLWRAYRTTVRLYTGDFTAGKKGVDVVAAPTPTVPGSAPANWLDVTLPWLSEPAAVIALGSLRSLTRAPEAKMLLLTPIIMLVVFGGAVFREPIDMPIFVRPLIAFGAMAMGFFTLAQITGNQFGFDRSGFRIFVLSPTPRRDILLGKNLSIAPLALLIGGMMLVMVEFLYPLRIDHLIALVPHWISMYLVFCMMMNLLSIVAPMRMAQGNFKPTTTRFIPMLLHFLFVFLMPMALAPTLLPLGIEFGVESLEWTDRLPICLTLSLAECTVVVCVYWVVLRWQGKLLQSREQAILDVVTTKAE
jgi:ABC-2 type transport system permease protein